MFGVTSVVQEACEQVDILGRHYGPSKVLTTQPSLSDIKQYFRRPRNINVGTLPATATKVWDAGISPDVVMNNWFDEGYVRILGCAGYKCTFVFTLQLTTTPFHQGIVVLGFELPSLFKRGDFNFSCTQVPHVRADLSIDTMVQLRVPWCFPNEYFPVFANSNLPYGSVFITNLTPTRSGTGVTAPRYRLMVHLEDFELIGARPMETTTVGFQSGNARDDPLNKEFDNEAFPMSSGIASAARALKWISKGVPSLASFTSTPAWAMGKAAGALRYFGYARPTIQDYPMRILRSTNASECNVDHASSIPLVSAFASNTVAINPELGYSNVDEMALDYVLTRWSVIRVVPVTTTSVPSTIWATPFFMDAFNWQPRTGAFNTLSPIAGTNAIYPSNLNFWASMFGQWAGDIEFRFTVSKTKFHGGRLLATYTPISPTFIDPFGVVGRSLTGEVPLVDATAPATVNPTGYSAIFDLRDSNTFTFDVPYIANVPMAAYGSNLGTISLQLYDPIFSSSVASDTVDIVVEVRAKPGFKLALPNGIMRPAAPSATAFQSGVIGSCTNEHVPSVTTGESFTSVKQLIMIPKASIFTVTTTGVNNVVFDIMPWYYQNCSVNYGANAIDVFPTETYSYGGNAASCYAYASGSTEVHAYALDGTLTFVSGAMAPMEGMTLSGQNQINRIGYRSGTPIPRIAEQQTWWHGKFPSYQRYARIISAWLNQINWGSNARNFFFNGVSELYPNRWPRLYLRIGATASTYISRAAGDDARLGFYMGPVPVGLRPAAAAGAPDPDALLNVLQSGFDELWPKAQSYNAPPSPLLPPVVEEVPTVVPDSSAPLPPAPPVLARTRSFRAESSAMGVAPANMAGALTSILDNLSKTVK